MTLIEDIIKELIDADKTLNTPLLWTKVLASKINNSVLLNWVDKELVGYNYDDNIPDYRKFKANIVGTYINSNKRYNDQPVPIDGLGEKISAEFSTMTIKQGVASLEFLKGDEKNGTLEYSFSAELVGYIQDNWIKMGNPNLQLINCKQIVSVGSVHEILASIRNKLLDFMLKISSEFGEDVNMSELIKNKDEIATIMNQTIITGDGNVFNTGDNVNITATINITKGNIGELTDYFKSNGINLEDIQELTDIVDVDEPNIKENKFGSKVNQWTSKMLNKALDGTWTVGLGAAGSLLAEGLKRYYGM